MRFERGLVFFGRPCDSPGLCRERGVRHVKTMACAGPAKRQPKWSAGAPGGRPPGRPADEVNQRPARIQPWMLFALPGAIAVPIIAGFLLGGPMLGFPLAALVAIVIVGVAI